MTIQITEERLSNESALITLAGQLNAASAPEVKACLKRMVESDVIQLV